MPDSIHAKINNAVYARNAAKTWWENKEPNILRVPFIADKVMPAPNSRTEWAIRGLSLAIGALIVLPFMPYMAARNFVDAKWNTLLSLPPLKTNAPIPATNDIFDHVHHNSIDLDEQIAEPVTATKTPYLESWIEWSLRRMARATIMGVGIAASIAVVGAVMMGVLVAKGASASMLIDAMMLALANTDIVRALPALHAGLSDVTHEIFSIAFLSTVGVAATGILSKIMHNTYKHEFNQKETLRHASEEDPAKIVKKLNQSLPSYIEGLNAGVAVSRKKSFTTI